MPDEPEMSPWTAASTGLIRVSWVAPDAATCGAVGRQSAAIAGDPPRHLRIADARVDEVVAEWQAAGWFLHVVTVTGASADDPPDRGPVAVPDSVSSRTVASVVVMARPDDPLALRGAPTP